MKMIQLILNNVCTSCQKFSRHRKLKIYTPQRVIKILNKPTTTKLNLLGKSTKELGLLVGSLEAAVAVLGRRVDEADVDGLGVGAAHGGQQSLSQGDGSLARASNAALEHEPVLVDFTVVREATHRGDALLGQISLSGSALVVALAADAQHSLVDLGSVVVTLLTSTSDSESDAGRMPGTDTGDLAETSVGLAGKTSHTPTRHHTGVTVTAGSGADIEAFTLSEHLGDVNLLLEQAAGEVDLGSDIGTTVDLDLQKVGSLLSELELADLGVGNDTNDLAVVLDALDLGINLLGLLGGLLGVLGESLPLGAVPVLVEASADVIVQVVGPNSGQGAETVGGLDVADNPHDNHGGSLQNGDGFHSLLLVELGSGSLDLTDNVSHASLVADEGSQVRRQRGIIPGEGSDVTSVVLRSLLGKVLKRPVSRGFELAVRHGLLKNMKGSLSLNHTIQIQVLGKRIPKPGSLFSH